MAPITTTGKVPPAATTSGGAGPDLQLMPLVSFCVATELGKLNIPMGEDFQTKLNYLQELQSLCLHEKLQFMAKKMEKLEQDFNMESLRKSEQLREHNEILQHQTAVIEEFAVWRFYLDQEQVNTKRTLQAMYEDQKGIQTIQDRMVTEQCKIKKELHILLDKLKSMTVLPSHHRHNNHHYQNTSTTSSSQTSANQLQQQQQQQELANRFLYLNSETTKLGLNMERVKSWQIEFGHQFRNLEGIVYDLRSKVESLSAVTPDVSKIAMVSSLTSDRHELDCEGDMKLDTEFQVSEPISAISALTTGQICNAESVDVEQRAIRGHQPAEDDTENLVSEVSDVCDHDHNSNALVESDKDEDRSLCSVDAVPDMPEEHPVGILIPAVIVTQATGSEDNENPPALTQCKAKVLEKIRKIASEVDKSKLFLLQPH